MHEIIHIVDAATYPGASRHDLEIEAVDERPLAAGYYFVLWPQSGAARKRGKRYFGPLRTAGEARLLLTSAVMLGLAEDKEARPAIAVCRSVARPIAANDCYAPRRIERRRVARLNG
jgi:hypothetical protein